MFNKFDTDGSGSLSFNEFLIALRVSHNCLHTSFWLRVTARKSFNESSHADH